MADARSEGGDQQEKGKMRYCPYCGEPTEPLMDTMTESGIDTWALMECPNHGEVEVSVNV